MLHSVLQFAQWLLVMLISWEGMKMILKVRLRYQELQRLMERFYRNISRDMLDLKQEKQSNTQLLQSLKKFYEKVEEDPDILWFWKVSLTNRCRLLQQNIESWTREQATKSLQNDATKMYHWRKRFRKGDETS